MAKAQVAQVDTKDSRGRREAPKDPEKHGQTQKKQNEHGPETGEVASFIQYASLSRRYFFLSGGEGLREFHPRFR